MATCSFGRRTDTPCQNNGPHEFSDLADNRVFFVCNDHLEQAKLIWEGFWYDSAE